MGADDFYYTSSPQSSESGFLKFMRCFLMAMNALITIAAIIGLAIGLMERQRMEVTLQGLCVHCKYAFSAYIITFSTIIACSLLGFVALCTRNVCLRALYFFYMFVVFVVALSISVMYLLVTRGDMDLEVYWNESVKGDDAMCGLELEFQCSGWKSLCRGPGEGIATPLSNAHNLHSDESYCPVCKPDDQKKIDVFSKTCETTVMDALKEYSKSALPVGFSVAGIAFITMLVTCLAHKKMRREASYGGRYYKV